MRPAINLSVQFEQLVCSCIGDFDLCARPVVRTAARRIAEDAHDVVVLDLSEVTFLDCGTIHALADVMRDSFADGKRAVVVCPDGFFSRLLTMTGFAAEFPVVSPALTGASTGRGRELRLLDGADGSM